MLRSRINSPDLLLGLKDRLLVITILLRESALRLGSIALIQLGANIETLMAPLCIRLSTLNDIR